MIVIFEITFLVSLDAKRTSFSTERTTVWFLHYTSKPQFCLLLWILTESFKNFWFPSTAPGTRVQTTVSASQWGTKAEPLQRHSTCSKFSPTVHWHVLRKKPHLPLIYKIILRQSSLTILQTSSMLPSVQPEEEYPECSSSSTEVSLRLNWQNQSKVHVLPMALSLKFVHNISLCFQCCFPQVQSKTYHTHIITWNQSLENCGSLVTCTTIYTCWEVM